MADLEAVLADVSYLMAMEKSKCTPAARASKKWASYEHFQKVRGSIISSSSGLETHENDSKRWNKSILNGQGQRLASL